MLEYYRGASMRIGFFQFVPEFGAVEKNLSRIENGLGKAEADLVVLPELATSGYLFTSREEVERLAEPVPGPTTERLQAVARRMGGFLAVGLPEKADSGIYNSAVLVGPEGIVGVYRKMHLFNEEKRFFKSGNLGFPTFEAAGVKIGLLVCFDHMFPEAARSLALVGAQIVCHPSNLVLPEYGQLTTRVRSLENRVFWVLANRFGTEERAGKRLHYTGCSQITAPAGRILASAPENEETLITVDIDPAEALNKKVTPFNDLLEDRRPGEYAL